MARNSKIEWCDDTWNPITGCALVSEGCRHCYAARLAATRLKNHPSRRGLARLNAAGEAKFTGEVRLNEDWLDQPLRWRRPRRIFACAHGDLFAEGVPDAWIDRVFAVMALSPRHIFQVLTKRPERMRAWFDRTGPKYGASDFVALAMEEIRPAATRGCVLTFTWPLPNVWLGTSVEDQATADARIPSLLDTPAAVRFLSAEPLLGPVDLRWIAQPDPARDGVIDALGGFNWIDGMGYGEHFQPVRPGHADRQMQRRRMAYHPRLDWVIAGGESGPHARPMHPDWPRALRDQCQAAGVAFFFKQWGEWGPHRPTAGGDLGGDVRRGSVTIVHPSGRDAVAVSESTGGRSTEPGSRYMARVGKARAGRQLDGREWSDMPGGVS